MTRSLGDVISIAKGKKHDVSESLSSSAKRLIGIDDLRNDNLLRYTEDRKGVEVVPEDILIAWDGANAGTIGFGKSGFIGSTIARLRIKSEAKLFAPFLGLFLKAQFDYLRKTATGATIPHINRKALESISLPEIDFDDQIRIAYLLSKVEGLIVQRKQHLQQLDELLKSVFLEMFGDPVRNEKGWDTVPFHKAGKFVGGGTPSKNREDFWNGSFPWVSPKDMKVIKINDSIDHISESVFNETSLKRIGPGHLLIVVRGMILAHSFPVAINAVDIAINQDMKAIKPVKGLNTSYFLNCLTSLKRKILKLISTSGHGTRKLDSIAMQKLFIPKPPIDLQNQFATIVEKVETLKSRYQKSLDDLESLYGAFSQQTFKGALDLSKVPLPDSAKLTNDVVEISEGSIQTLKSSEKVINKLNTFNSQHAMFLEALNNMPSLKIINSPVFKAARELTEQAALWRTPLDQFKNMRSVAKAAETIAAASNIPRVNNAALLAQQIAKAIPKVDMDWLKEQQAIIKGATGPFSEMRQAIAALKLSDLEGRLTGPDYKIPALHAAMPSETSSRLTKTFKQDDGESEPRYIFTRDDILQALSGDKSLSIVNLMSELAKLEAITSQGYERVKSLIFSLLAEKQIQQQYNDEENTIAFRTCV